MENQTQEETKLDIHSFFNLTYASYLTLPRSVLQSMPEDWQHKFTALVMEITETLDIQETPTYRVCAIDSRGKFIKDPFQDYERGRRQFPFKDTFLKTQK